jgi:hypothetical protein
MKGFVHGNAGQPSRELRLFLKRPKMEENFLKSVLHYIFGILVVIGYPLRHGKNYPFVAKNQFLESLHVSVLGGSHKRDVGAFVYTGCLKRCHESIPHRYCERN